MFSKYMQNYLEIIFKANCQIILLWQAYKRNGEVGLINLVNLAPCQIQKSEVHVFAY